MSAIAGVLLEHASGIRSSESDADDRARRAAVLKPMLSILASYRWAGQPLDGRGIVDDGAVAMAVCALDRRQEPRGRASQRSAQPVHAGDLLLAWDGRLDNRAELTARLELAPDTADADIVAAAYRRWQEGFARELVGDFAVALHDAVRRRLILARDPFAARPLFFSNRPGATLWASTVGALAASGWIPLDIDDDWVGAYLISAESSRRSPFTDVDIVGPGEVVVLDSAGLEGELRRFRFWRPEDGESIRFSGDGEYEEAFRELFLASVRNRLRGSGPVMAELSGGLDSSSIVCAADRLIAGGRVGASELHTMSWVYDRAAGADERPFIEVVEQHLARSTEPLLEDDFPMLTGFENEETFTPHPWQSWPLARRRAAQLMRQKGATILLSGFAGDHLLWSEVGSPSHLADYLVGMRPGQLLRELRGWHRAGEPLPKLIWQGVLKPLWQLAGGRSNAHELDFSFAWLSQEARRRMAGYFASSLERRRRGLLPSRLLRAETLRWAVNTRSWMHDDLEHGFETCCPFLDRPLVEFCLAIPFEQLARPGEGRSLHRRSMKGILPEIVRVRECKRGPSDATMLAFRREWPVIRELFEGRGARLYQRGLVDREAFLKELKSIRHGVYGDHAIVVRALQVEVWLRFIERYSSSRQLAA